MRCGITDEKEGADPKADPFAKNTKKNGLSYSLEFIESNPLQQFLHQVFHPLLQHLGLLVDVIGVQRNTPSASEAPSRGRPSPLQRCVLLSSCRC